MTVFSFAACDDYTEPNPPAQSNKAESILQPSDIEVSVEVSETVVYDLTALNNIGESIVLADVYCNTLPEGYAFAAEGEMSTNNFQNKYQVPMTVVAVEEESRSEGALYQVYISPDDLQGVYNANITNSPDSASVQLRYWLETVKGSEVAYVGGPDDYFGPYTIHFIPLPPTMVLEETYYLISSANDWSFEDAIAFNFVSDKNIYDDPTFRVLFEATDGASQGFEWKIIPQSTYAAGVISEANYAVFGVTEASVDSMSGSLSPQLDSIAPVAGRINADGYYQMTINLNDMTFSILEAVDKLYSPGDMNSWKPDSSLILTTSDYINYSGYITVKSEFKFNAGDTWYGVGSEDGTLSTDGGNIQVTKAGLYWATVNVDQLTYELTYIETYGVIGDATEGGWDNSTPLTPNADYTMWRGNIDFAPGGWKFRANDGWAVNLGANADEEPSDNYADLVQGGKNLTSPGTGTYFVVLDLSQVPYATIVTEGAQEIPDDGPAEDDEDVATWVAGKKDDKYLRGGWDTNWAALPEYQFTTSETENVWTTGTVQISSGTEFKVADTNWGSFNYGYGDNGELSIVPGTDYKLQYNKGNLVMGSDFNGVVTLKFDGSDWSLLFTQK